MTYIDNIDIIKNENYIYVYEKLGENSIRLIHMFGKSPLCIVPAVIDGMQVTELAPYCFSSKSLSEELKARVQSKVGIDADMTELSDRYIQNIILPDGIRKIGRLAFYNCRNLARIELPADIESVDGDAFMNCTKLSNLVMCGDPKTRSCLKQILAQISWLVRVSWVSNSDINEHMSNSEAGTLAGSLMYDNVQNSMQNSTQYRTIAQACFFEYDQTYDEIGPAHIFKLNMNGEGFRARQSFNDQVFVWKQYDDTFEEAKAQESERDLLDMAFYRLVFPYELDDTAKRVFCEYVKAHGENLGEMLIQKRDVSLLERYLDLVDTDGNSLADAQTVTDMVAKAAAADWGEGSVILLRFKKKYLTVSRKNRFSF